MVGQTLFLDQSGGIPQIFDGVGGFIFHYYAVGGDAARNQVITHTLSLGNRFVSALSAAYDAKRVGTSLHQLRGAVKAAAKNDSGAFVGGDFCTQRYENGLFGKLLGGRFVYAVKGNKTAQKEEGRHVKAQSEAPDALHCGEKLFGEPFKDAFSVKNDGGGKDGYDQNADEYGQKPLAPDELLEKVEYIVGHHKKRREKYGSVHEFVYFQRLILLFGYENILHGAEKKVNSFLLLSDLLFFSLRLCEKSQFWGNVVYNR